LLSVHHNELTKTGHFGTQCIYCIPVTGHVVVRVIIQDRVCVFQSIWCLQVRLQLLANY